MGAVSAAAGRRSVRGGREAADGEGEEGEEREAGAVVCAVG